MRHGLALVLLGFWAGLASAGATLKDARQNLLRGNYAEAREQFAALAKGPERARAVVGQSRAIQSQGDVAKALGVVETALKDLPKDADLLARKAELLYQTGRWDEAEQTAKMALEAAEGNYLGHWVLAQLARDRGDLNNAEEQFVWFVRAYNDREITDPDDLILVGLAALERARVKHQGDQFQFVLTEIFKESLKLDKNYWPGEYEAGKIFVEKHNKADAHKALDRALTINPRAAEVLVAKGQLALAGFEMQDAEQFADQALKINPSLTTALRLKADVYWFGGDIEAALKGLHQAQTVNPREEETLARLAACLHAQKKTKDFDALVRDVEKHNAKPYLFYAALADLLEARKNYDDAEKYFKVAVDLRPELPDGLSGLGMLYMRLGKEAQARKTLEQAFEADNFNIRVSNSLKVLDHLDKYATLKTEHFIFRYDPKNDQVLAKYMARYLEEVYKELADKFNYGPKQPILIEIFNRHEMFSGRIVALPDLHTIGACTGPIFAMVSPHDKSGVIPKAFNWVRVVRHELVHVFNLEQTRYQVPHWFTEGLAVEIEGSTTPPSWHYLLAEKVRAGDLLNLDNILLGFVRPRSPAQWQQAYLQSQLYVEYLQKTHGPKSVGKMLGAFEVGLDTGPALEKACGTTKEQFEKGYRAFLDERLKEIAIKPQAKTQTLKALKEAYAKDPADADTAAQLAEAYYKLGKKKDAAKLVDTVLETHPKHPLAAYVKALSLIDAKDQDVAYTLLNNVVTDDSTEIKPLKLLARVQFETKRYPEAARTLERCRKLEPYNTEWLGQLAKVYKQTEDTSKLIDIYRDVARFDYDDALSRKELAKHYSEKGNEPEAERYARQLLEIDVTDADGQRILLAALRAQGKEREADELRKIFAGE